MNKVLASVFLFAAALHAGDVASRWSFNQEGLSGLTFKSGAGIEEASSPSRRGVLSFGENSGVASLNSGLIPEDFDENNFTFSLMFRCDPLPPIGSASAEDQSLFKSERLSMVVRRGNDGGNAGTIFAMLQVGAKKVLFKPNVRVDDGRWHRVTLRSDARKNRVQVFLDGQLHASRDVEGSAPLLATAEEFVLGPAPAAQVDELSIHNVALDDAAVRSAFNYAYYGVEDRNLQAGIDSVRIFIPANQPEFCARYSQIFARHLMGRAPAVKVSFESQRPLRPAERGELLLVAGVAGVDAGADALLREGLPRLPSVDRPGPEGFSLKVAPSGDGLTAWVAGTDERGVLYGLGRLLLLSQKEGFRVGWPQALEVVSAPRVELRSANSGAFKLSMDVSLAKKTGARAWSVAEGITYWEESLLFGVNFYTYGRGRVTPVNLESYRKDGRGIALATDQVCADYGMHICISQSVNGLGRSNMKPGWNALNIAGQEDPHLACMSIPEAREAIIETWEIYAKESQRLDSALLAAADIAGCHCEACRKDWPKMYYELCCDIAEVVHRWKPDAKLYFSNQEMSFEQNEELFELVRRDRNSPLAGYIYAPAGSENSTYGYLLKNPRWDRYPGLYPDSTFLKSRLSYLQPGQDIVSFPDISHWKRAECGVAYADPIISEVYPRRTYTARPLAYSKAFDERMAYCSGVSGYSEGNHDDFNKYYLMRLAWDPDLEPREIAREYYAYYCGPEAGELLADAVFLGEQIRENPFRRSGETIRRYRQLVQQAGDCMPPEYLAGNWRYYQMDVRSLIDLYLYERMKFQQQQVKQAEQLMRAAGDSADPSVRLREAQDVLSGQFESDLLDQARVADDITDKAIGLRSYALKVADSGDVAGVYWLKDQIEMILQQSGAYAQCRMIQGVLNYDQVGPDEFYDNCGTIDQQPNYDFESGELYYGTGSWPKETRPSQRWYNYSFEAQDGLEFSYSGLDTNAEYTVTVTWPNPTGVSFALNSPNAFYVEADGVQVGMVTPPDRVEQFSFDLPVAVTQDGILNVALRKVTGQSRCTCISEIWVRKKDKAD
ncbi:laminin G domain-containing protein [Tichowtungia aerotolerans]|uniref:Laminin G domain-containing protein n=1 Tax=Tichowtungia aerotolerans TaxID=2697043 RepID=A0A6P1M6C8_9BACT|nr:laminin G domain-containing protein [Tichowtungia aerotolerans]QHI69417.1 hypothetical protein GT409_08105 [Tichowtungia aerotolerans]